MKASGSHRRSVDDISMSAASEHSLAEELAEFATEAKESRKLVKEEHRENVFLDAIAILENDEFDEEAWRETFRIEGDSTLKYLRVFVDESARYCSYAPQVKFLSETTNKDVHICWPDTRYLWLHTAKRILEEFLDYGLDTNRIQPPTHLPRSKEWGWRITDIKLFPEAFNKDGSKIRDNSLLFIRKNWSGVPLHSDRPLHIARVCTDEKNKSYADFFYVIIKWSDQSFKEIHGEIPDWQCGLFFCCFPIWFPLFLLHQTYHMISTFLIYPPCLDTTQREGDDAEDARQARHTRQPFGMKSLVYKPSMEMTSPSSNTSGRF